MTLWNGAAPISKVYIRVEEESVNDPADDDGKGTLKTVSVWEVLGTLLALTVTRVPGRATELMLERTFEPDQAAE